MKKILPLLLLLVTCQVNAQIFWTENFGTGCNQGATASSYAGSNGAWTVSSAGTNDDYANEWFVSATTNNNGAGNCADGCGSNPTLHIGNPAIAFYALDADLQATYLTGVFCISGYCSTTNKRAESPEIDCTGMSEISISFIYIEGGDNDLDDAQLMYYDGSSWYTLDVLAKTTTCNTFSGIWTQYIGALPSSADNNPNVKIGFLWTNNNDSQGSDPSFAVDDIVLGSSSSACIVDLLATDATCTDSCNGGIVVTSSGSSPFTYNWSNGSTSSNLTDLCAGNYAVTMTDADGCSASAFAIINEPDFLVVTDSITAASCGTCVDGSASLDVNGGTSPYTFAWSNGSTTGTITNILPGVYYVTITDFNGCTIMDSVSVSFLENVQETFTKSFNIYPNPADNTIAIECESNTDVLIVDITGRKIISHHVESNQTQINIGQLASGTYLVQLLRNDKTIGVGKLAVMH